MPGSSRYLGLKRALQGPRGAGVCEQDGQSWGSRREELQEKEVAHDQARAAP